MFQNIPKLTKAIAFSCLLIVLSVQPGQQGLGATGSIFTTQIGFATKDEKFAVLAVSSAGAIDQKFSIVDASTGEIAFSGLLQGPSPSWIASDAVGDTYRLEFTGLITPGTYRVISNGLSSFPFVIRDAIYDVRVGDGLNFFEVQDSASTVSWVSLDGFEGGHGPSHLDDARKGVRTDSGGGDRKLIEQSIPSEFPDHLDVSGGWYDAGDYNKYMGNTPWAVYNLLLAYEDGKGASIDYWNFDRNRNGSPDILDHATVALSWMAKMVWTDGAVFERVFNGYKAPFDGHPDFETDRESGTADDRPLDSDRYADITAKSAYAFAAAARVFPQSNYLDLAKQTWAWAYQNQGTLKPKKYGGGLYFGDIDIGLVLGAIELVRSGVTTVANVDLKSFIEGRITAHVAARDWTDPSSWDYQSSYVLERYYDYPEAVTRTKSSILEALETAYRNRIARQSSNAYRINDEWLLNAGRRGTSFGQNDLAVSSAYDALWLFMNSSATDRGAFRTYALNQIQWVWGRNPFGESWLASDFATEFTRNMTWKATARHPISGVVVPGATDWNANGIPDYTDSGEYFYAEPTINQQAMYIRTLALMDRLTRGPSNPDFRPTVTITQPVTGQLVSDPVQFISTATDDVGISRVTWAIDFGASQDICNNSCPNGSPLTWSWPNPSQGTHVITVTAYDTAGQTRKSEVTVQVINVASNVMLVRTLIVTLNEKGGAKGQVQGKMNATITDGAGNPIAGALVTGHWEGSATDTFSVSTDTAGAMLDYSNAVSKSGTVTFTAVIDTVTKDGWVLDKPNSPKTSDTVIKTY